MNIIKLQGGLEKRNGIYYEYDVDAVPLGEGGMGRVFKGFRVVERTEERTPVAIKAIYENIPEHVVERARREAEIQLDNDNLIRMYGFVETVSTVGNRARAYYHVVMELLIGVTLENIINGITVDQGGMQIPFAAEIYNQYVQDRNTAVIRIMKSILSGLMALHDKGFIHRDIDPSNIMLTIDGKIKLIDFGICKQIVSLESLDKALTATGVFMGKVNYAAPELVLGDVKSQNYTTDIYALGVLLYQLSTGHLPFSGTDQDILSANLRCALPMKDVKCKDFRKIIKKATDKTQTKRYASVAEMRVDLEKAAVGQHAGIGKGVIGAGMAVLFLLAVGGIYLLFNQDGPEPDDEAVAAVQEPDCEELYNKALQWLSMDSTHLHAKAIEQLSLLVNDKSYGPAKIKYYTVMLNSNVPDEAVIGFNGLQEILQEDSLNGTALFECGLTLSKGNNYFNVPVRRQSVLNIQMDFEKANTLLYKAMDVDMSDYKSVYWAFNNLMERKLTNKLPADEDGRLVMLFNLFKERVEKSDDPVAEYYRMAIKNDKETLKAWGLIH